MGKSLLRDITQRRVFNWERLAVLVSLVLFWLVVWQLIAWA